MKNDRDVKVITKVCEGAGGYAAGKLITCTNRQISLEEWDNFRLKLDSAKFWQLPARSDDRSFDGAEWILEGRSGDKYHYAAQWTPGGGNFKACCEYLIQLSGLQIPERDYY